MGTRVTKSTALLTQHILSQIVNLIELPIMLLDIQQESLPLIFANPCCQELLEQLCGRGDNLVLGEMLDEQTPSPAASQIVSELASGAQLTLRMRAGSAGSLDGLTLRLLPLHDKSGATTHALGLVAGAAAASRPQPKKVLAEAPGAAESAVDRVTGLLLQPAFESRVAACWNEAAMNEAGVGVMVFRIDDFDRYIETFGKQAANSARRLIGHAISGSLRRAEDLAAGLAERVVSRVVALCIHHPRSEVTRYLSISAGVAFAAAADTTFADVLSEARRRAGVAREQGGNRVSFPD